MKALSRLRSKKDIYLKLYAKGWFIFAVALSAASALCALLQQITASDVHVPLIFVLAVLVVSLLTDGYFYGFLAAFVSVIGVNYAFTYPYMKLDFSIYGYPLTFMTMLAVGFATSTLTTRLKEHERLRVESEREKMRANLLRAISHDLRTPLTAISGSITTVLEDDGLLDTNQKKELLTDAKQDAEWLYRMVENLLSITRINEGAVGAIAKEEEVLEEVLSEAVMSFRKRHEDIPVSVSVPETLLMLPMDAMLIEQVLINLMDNAVMHGEGLTHIEVRAEERDNMAVINVCDDGCGIDEALLPHLFDGSLQLSGGDSSADRSRFMGIGLSVCRTIVEAHGGKITAENSVNGGAVFTFTLPIGAEKNDNKG